jgi:cytochrome c oxidase subunit 2
MDENNMSLEEKSGSSNNMIWVLVVLVLLVGGGFWYYQSKYMTPSTNTTLASGEPVMVEAEGVKAFTLDAADYKYTPNEIRVKKGDKVKITVTTSEDKMKHNFTVDEYGIESDNAEKGKPITFEFTADKVGEFEFYCSIYDHREKGQKGTLIVTE